MLQTTLTGETELAQELTLKLLLNINAHRDCISSGNKSEGLTLKLRFTVK